MTAAAGIGATSISTIEGTLRKGYYGKCHVILRFSFLQIPSINTFTITCNLLIARLTLL